MAVANTPGLAGSLLVGLAAAKALALAWRVPLVAVNHLQAHIYACRLAAGEEVFPCVGLIASGGHSSLYRCRTPLEFDLLGGTIDDAAGEAFDKVASLLGLGFPGGPAIERRGREGNPRAFELPRPLLKDEDALEFSFSGLKTAVRYRIAGAGETLPPTRPPGRATSWPIWRPAFQEAVVDCLVGKSLLALRSHGPDTLCVGGGVAANSRSAPAADEATAGRRQRAARHSAAATLHRQCRDGSDRGGTAAVRDDRNARSGFLPGPGAGRQRARDICQSHFRAVQNRASGADTARAGAGAGAAAAAAKNRWFRH